VRRVGAGVAAMTSYLVPVVTLVLAVVLLGDRPEPLQLLGGLVILAGVRLATLRLAGDGQAVPEGAA
jgi:drug/metabolite transporter (DMT)-like permease